MLILIIILIWFWVVAADITVIVAGDTGAVQAGLGTILLILLIAYLLGGFR